MKNVHELDVAHCPLCDQKKVFKVSYLYTHIKTKHIKNSTPTILKEIPDIDIDPNSNDEVFQDFKEKLLLPIQDPGQNISTIKSDINEDYNGNVYFLSVFNLIY